MRQIAKRDLEVCKAMAEPSEAWVFGSAMLEAPHVPALQEPGLRTRLPIPTFASLKIQPPRRIPVSPGPPRGAIISDATHCKAMPRRSRIAGTMALWPAGILYLQRGMTCPIAHGMTRRQRPLALPLVVDIEANGEEQNEALDPFLVVDAQAEDGHADIHGAHQ